MHVLPQIMRKELPLAGRTAHYRSEPQYMAEIPQLDFSSRLRRVHGYCRISLPEFLTTNR